jgi:hypothetical protein
MRASRDQLPPVVPPEQISFTLTNVTFTNFPFTPLPLSLSLESNPKAADPVMVSDYEAKWPKPVRFNFSMQCDNSGRLLPTVIDVKVNGLPKVIADNGPPKSVTCEGKLDLAHIVRRGGGSYSIPMVSTVLDSSITFDAECVGGDRFREPRTEGFTQIPDALASPKTGWLSINQQADSFEADVQLLIAAAKKPA